jgi:hypothetical protein
MYLLEDPTFTYDGKALTRGHKIRLAKKFDVVKPAFDRGYKADEIDVLLSDDESDEDEESADEEFHPQPVLNPTTYKIKEKSIKLDFIEKVKK